MDPHTACRVLGVAIGASDAEVKSAYRKCALQFHPEKSGARGIGIFKNFLEGNVAETDTPVVKSSASGTDKGLARRVIACLDVRSNDNGDLVVTKGDSYDVREKSEGGDVRNLGKPVELAKKYYDQGADEVAFLNITGYRDLPLNDAPMLEVLKRSSETVFVPLTVGGVSGTSPIATARATLRLKWRLRISCRGRIRLASAATRCTSRRSTTPRKKRKTAPRAWSR